MMPFITEEIWHYLPGTASPLIVSQWPTSEKHYARPEAEAQMDTIRDLVVKVRQVRLEYDVDPGKRITALAGGNGLAAVVSDHPQIFSRLCNVERLERLADGSTPEQAAVLVSGDVTLYLPLAGMVDFAAERERLLKEMDNLTVQIEKSEKMLANEGFVSRARPDVVQRERDKLAELRGTRATVEERLRALPQ
jgi:valyl-tRNA synthetase